MNDESKSPENETEPSPIEWKAQIDRFYFQQEITPDGFIEYSIRTPASEGQKRNGSFSWTGNDARKRFLCWLLGTCGGVIESSGLEGSGLLDEDVADAVIERLCAGRDEDYAEAVAAVERLS